MGVAALVFGALAASALQGSLQVSASVSASVSPALASISSSGAPEPEGQCEPARLWESHGGLLLYFALVAYIFYGFEIICDEFFVPALNVTCDRLGIPDDVAGATLMALGGNMPDIFSGATGVLILHTNVGAGTIVGSLLFNHLCIIGAAALAVPGGIVLELRSLTRDLLFYALSLGLLLVFLIDEYITAAESTTLVAVYVVYMLVCSLSSRINSACARAFRCCAPRAPAGHERELLSEPLIAGEHVDLSVAGEPVNYGAVPSVAAATGAEAPAAPAATPEAAGQEPRQRLERESARAFEAVKQRLSERLPTGHQVGFDYGEVHMHGYMWKKSHFYSKARVSSRMWQKRWFALDEELWYCRNPLFPEQQRRVVPLWCAFRIEHDEEDTRVFHVHTTQIKYTFRAPTTILAHQWADAMRERVSFIRDSCPDLSTDKGVVTEAHADDDDESLFAVPEKAGQRALWAVTLPWALLFSFTIPNVKRHRFRNLFAVSMLLVIAWLAVMAYGMVWAAERFACIVGIPQDIMGLSITAIGASLPSLFSSVIAAREGSASMAVSNAFGANVCSILVAFGLPCFLQSVLVERGRPYHIASDSIPTAVVVLTGALALFVAVIAATRLRIGRALGGVFVGLYVALLALVIVLNSLGLGIDIPEVPW
eukprot:m51a1_g3661 putative sodium potassium calcium exchanger 4 isoform 1 (655) ;mRNA; f:235656-238345